MQTNIDLKVQTSIQKAVQSQANLESKAASILTYLSQYPEKISDAVLAIKLILKSPTYNSEQKFLSIFLLKEISQLPPST